MDWITVFKEFGAIPGIAAVMAWFAYKQYRDMIAGHEAQTRRADEAADAYRAEKERDQATLIDLIEKVVTTSQMASSSVDKLSMTVQRLVDRYDRKDK